MRIMKMFDEHWPHLFIVGVHIYFLAVAVFIERYDLLLIGIAAFMISVLMIGYFTGPHCSGGRVKNHDGDERP